MMRELQDTKAAVDERLGASAVQLFSSGDALAGDEAAGGGAPSDDGSEDEPDEEEGPGSADEEDESESESSDGEGGGEPKRQPADGRKRRRAVFSGDAPMRAHAGVGVRVGAAAPGGGGSGMEDSEGESEEESAGGDESADESVEGSDGEEEEEERGPAGESNTAWWRENMLSKQAAIFAVRPGDLKRMVYSATATKSTHAPQASAAAASHAEVGGGSSGEEDEDSDGEELFQLKGSHRASTAGAQQQSGAPHDDIDVSDSPYLDLDGPAAALARWQGGAAPAVQGLRHRIVTGGEAAFNDAHARSMTDGVGANDEGGSEGDEVYGDFEDVEMGKVFSGA